MEITPAFIREVQNKATKLITHEQLQHAFDRMAVEITEKLADKDPLFLVIMNGALFCAAEIMRRLNFPMQMDYVQATRYCGKTHGSTIQWKKEPGTSVKNRVVVIIDDILDGGLTFQAVIDYCYGEGAKEVYTAVMLDKPTARLPNVLKSADFTGIAIENKFVYGCGLDYYEYLRNVPDIYVVAPEHML